MSDPVSPKVIEAIRARLHIHHDDCCCLECAGPDSYGGVFDVLLRHPDPADIDTLFAALDQVRHQLAEAQQENQQARLMLWTHKGNNILEGLPRQVYCYPHKGVVIPDEGSLVEAAAAESRSRDYLTERAEAAEAKAAEAEAAVTELVEDLMSVFEERPNARGSWVHLGYCSASRQHPPGQPKSGCVCLRSVKSDRTQHAILTVALSALQAEMSNEAKKYHALRKWAGKLAALLASPSAGTQEGR